MLSNTKQILLDKLNTLLNGVLKAEIDQKNTSDGRYCFILNFKKGFSRDDLKNALRKARTSMTSLLHKFSELAEKEGLYFSGFKDDKIVFTSRKQVKDTRKVNTCSRNKSSPYEDNVS